jgi:hypothetical protein
MNFRNNNKLNFKIELLSPELALHYFFTLRFHQILLYFFILQKSKYYLKCLTFFRITLYILTQLNQEKMQIVLFYITILFSVINFVSCSFHHLFSKHSIEDVHKKTTSITHSSLIVCGEDTCQIIKKYTIAENNTFDCFDENLLISFELVASNRSKITYNGFLMPNTKILVDKQIRTEFCKKIRRFIIFYFSVSKQRIIKIIFFSKLLC